ncbi:DNA polymerase III subunit beta [Tuberibacillus sp. Marseille-P3662]|uniref:DNA polymerase III subunit beta n=1 Tax=Tuberibacillus sp. Marseille-P3662 TaxID=1965358 RepID=UPI000A1CE999|nr:DNA polymerase III subunit beta [Tuberibacillus sp. Marseille-P3662]
MQDIENQSTLGDAQVKFSIAKDQLVNSVNDIMKAVSNRTTIPILTGIKITAGHDGISMTGSDSDISIKSYIPLEDEDHENAVVDKPGSIVLQAKVFADIVKKLPSEFVNIEVDSRLMTRITAGSAEFNLNGLDAEEYPRLPVIDENESISIRTDLLKNVIRQTVFSVSTSETRPVLTGVNWTIQNGKLDCVATDSHRLASKSITVETGETNEQHYNVVLPGKSLNELSKILDESRGDWVNIVITDNQVLFKAKNIEFFSRLLDGNYPDTNRLIPDESKTDIIVSTKSLYQAIDRASLLAKEERNNVIKFQTISDHQIEVSSHSAELGRVFENIEAKSIEGEALKISFSAKYMMDVLSRMDTQDVRVSFTGAMRPFLIRPTEDQGLIMLILPVRTN